MNPNLRELYDQERGIQEEISAMLVDPAATEEGCNALCVKLDKIRGKIALAKTAGEEPDGEHGEPLPNPQNTQLGYNGEIFYKALTSNLSPEEKTVVSTAMRQYKALLTGKKPEDGGYVVPEDIAQEIIRAIVEEESVRNLVMVEPVTTQSGGRIVRKGKPYRLFNTEERTEIEMMNNPQFDVIDYDIHKYAGLMDVPSELLADAFISFVAEIRMWLSDAARETENLKVFYGAGGKDPVGLLYKDVGDSYYKELAAPDVMDIRTLRNMKNAITKGYRRHAKWVMNTAAFELISNIEDKNGRGILAVDPRKEDAFILFSRPVEIYDTIETDDNGKTDIMFGNFKRGYRMFDRRAISIKVTNIGAGAFEADTTVARGVSRFDGQRMDSHAIVIMRDVDTLAMPPESGQGLLAPLALQHPEEMLTEVVQKIDGMYASAEILIKEMFASASAKVEELIAAAKAKDGDGGKVSKPGKKTVDVVPADGVSQ